MKAFFETSFQGDGKTSRAGNLTATIPCQVKNVLPNGDLLIHAYGDFVTSTGTRLEGRGVIPDEEVPLRREDLLAGRDATLGAALAWIDTRRETASTDGR